MLFKHGKT